MIRVFVSGPYSKGDTMANIRNAIDAANELRNHGFAPYVPHLSAYWHTVHPRSYESWMELDFEWLGQCHAVLRLPGESDGADRECALARDVGIPVYTDIAQLRKDSVWLGEHEGFIP